MSWLPPAEVIVAQLLGAALAIVIAHIVVHLRKGGGADE